jgi:hypothetical protein
MKNIIEKNPPHKHTACQTKIPKERKKLSTLKIGCKVTDFFQVTKKKNTIK